MIGTSLVMELKGKLGVHASWIFTSSWSSFVRLSFQYYDVIGHVSKSWHDLYSFKNTQMNSVTCLIYLRFYPFYFLKYYACFYFPIFYELYLSMQIYCKKEILIFGGRHDGVVWIHEKTCILLITLRRLLHFNI